MRTRLLFFLLFGLGLHTIYTSAQSKQPQQSGSGSASSAESSKPPAQSPAGSATPAAKPKKVYTEDDFKSSGGTTTPNGDLDFSKINSCDDSCFAEMQRGGVLNSDEYSHWRETALQAINNIKADSDWQATLHEYARYHAKFCALERERDKAIKPGATQREQGSIQEDYNRKKRALGDEMRSTVHSWRLDASALGKGALRYYELRFAEHQVNAILAAPCPSTP